NNTSIKVKNKRINKALSKYKLALQCRPAINRSLTDVHQLALISRGWAHNPPLIPEPLNRHIYLTGISMHVLVCEDDELIASGIKAGLTAQGMTVEHVASAGAAR